MAWSQTAADVQSTCAFTKCKDFSSCIVYINASVQWALLWYTLKSHVVIQCCFAELLALFVYGIHLRFMFSLALSLGVIILCRLQLRDSHLPRMWKSLIPACIRPSSHDVLLRLSQFWCHCACLPLCSSKWKQVKSRLTVPDRAEPSKATAVQNRGYPDAGGSKQSVREQSFPGCFGGVSF